MEKYFAYGSNINLRQMKERCPSSVFHSKATLKDYKLVFPFESSARWGGGVSGIKKENGDEVEGVVYEMTDADIKTLDGWETGYDREKIKVTTEDGRALDVWVYIPKTDFKREYKPSKKYIETILEGAKQHKMSDKFIKYCEDLLK
jgi:gamma-glutamylcyclotransferase